MPLWIPRKSRWPFWWNTGATGERRRPRSPASSSRPIFLWRPRLRLFPKRRKSGRRFRRRRILLIDRRLIQNFDWYLILFTLTLIIIGVLNIYSATYQTEEGLRTPIYMKQIYWAAIGLLFLIVVVVFDYHLLLSLALPLYGVSVVLLLGVLLFGRSISGSQRWITIASFSFQPS
ncbi:MAG: hypothetical protein EHM75_01490, partial [Desulfobacteraceae bacterium]